MNPSSVRPPRRASKLPPYALPLSALLLAASALALSVSLLLVPRVSEAFALVREEHPVTLTVEEGDGLPDLARALQESGAIRYPGTFRLYAHWQNAAAPVPGTYSLTGSESYRTLLRKLTE